MPLWLVLENVDPIGEQIYAIYKAGDDLRQDQLTLRMISIMDKVLHYYELIQKDVAKRRT